MADKRHIHSLTSLRFIAATAVVFFHARHYFFGGFVESAPTWLQSLMASGFTAVNFFYVLSGFILAFTYGEGDVFNLNRGRFWKARIARKYPVFLVSLIVSAPFGFNNLLHDGSFAEVSWKFLLSGWMNLALFQAWFPHFALGWNPPSWSLSNEALFYLLFPWVGMLAWRVSKNHLVSSIAATWILGILVTWFSTSWFPSISSLSAGEVSTQTAAILESSLAVDLKFLPLFHLCEFFSGVLLGRLFLLRCEERSDSFGPLVTCSLIALVGVLSFSDHVPFFILHNGLLTPLFAWIIYGLARGAGGWNKFLSHPKLILLGETSYALYILHYPILGWFIFLEKYGQISRWIPLAAQGAIYFVFAIGVSIISYKAIEEPCRKRIKNLSLFGVSANESQSASVPSALAAKDCSYSSPQETVPEVG